MIGERIRFLRTKAKKTQKDIFQATGIPSTTISYWENGRSEPTVSDVKKLAEALGVSLLELIEGQDQQAACLPKTG